MHKLTLSAPVNLGPTIGVLPAGSYIAHDVNSFEIAQIAERGTAKLEECDSGHLHHLSVSAGNRVIVMRSGAWGDLLLLEPALRAYKAANPDKEILLACFAHHFEMTQWWGVETIRYPIEEKKFKGARTIIDLQNAELDRDLHMTDAFAKMLGVTVSDYKPTFHLMEPKIRPRTNSKRPIVGFNPAASVANRSYPLDKAAQLINELLNAEWEIWLFGKPGQLPELKPNPRIRDISRESKSFQESAAYLKLCDAFIGVDSALLHLCHALDVRAVGLFAAFPWQLRTGHAPLTRALTGLGTCAPCFHHVHAGRQFPAGMPCEAAGHCTVLAGIEPSRIVAAVEKLKPPHA